MKKIAVILAFIGSNACYQVALARVDSIGIIDINKIKYILHKVEPKETLYAISKRYNTAAEIIKYANSVDTVLQVGVLLKVPKNPDSSYIKSIYKNLAKQQQKANANDVSKQNAEFEKIKNEYKGVLAEPNGDPVYYTAQKGDNLYKISKLVDGLNVDKLNAWNNISEKPIADGQRLIVGYKKGGKKINQPTTANTETKNKTEKDKKTTDGNPSERKINTPAENEIMKQIVCTWDDKGIINPYKKYALHRWLAYGTIVKITNNENDQHVFVKIVGKLPETDDNEAIDLKISRAAAEQIGVLDRRFRATISYGKN